MAPPLHARREGAVDGGLQRGPRAEAPAEPQELRAPLQELGLGALVEGDVRAPEAVDGLLGVADDEEAASAHRALLVLDEAAQDLDLKGVAVLHLVDEEVAVAGAQLGEEGRVEAQQIAGEQEQVEEVQGPRVDLEGLVDLEGPAQLLTEEGGEVGVEEAEGPIEGGAGAVPAPQAASRSTPGP